MKFGLKSKHINSINTCFEDFPQIQKVILYGSRAMGNYRPGSDIDLVIEGNISFSDLLRLETILDDLLLPWKIDLSLKYQIDNPDLLEHIDQVGKEFYNREKQAVLKEPRAPYSNNSKS